jgi:hypothetical protein
VKAAEAIQCFSKPCSQQKSVFYKTETELKIRNEIERKMQDIQPNVEK